MKKDYRKFTVGELLDMGFQVEVSKHWVKTEDEGKRLSQTFEGTKQSSYEVKNTLVPFKVVKAWKEEFSAKFFIREEMK
ncbi:hypothetical protein SAMN05877753_105376 [Bacillus oleivorans]|uniref:Uncharacterized protein n=1 Tax=Bacillus oleivorans TaxID=1448271 RepID=A0A285CXM0_9BACI|nr:hypothetical protein [Bacillus oleivorans]SNX71786.1 hypothetical protein SAMN05877753_105376 [Bacillus oleivorans]